MTVAIVPAGGRATRIHGIPKMLLPTLEGTLMEVLYQRLLNAGVRHVAIMTKGATGELLRDLGYEVHLRYDRSASEAVMLARDTMKAGERALFAMPDTYFDDEQAFDKLNAAIDDDADVAVGLFHARHDQRNGGMCRVAGNQVVEIVDKPESGSYPFIWGVLAWGQRFWECMDADDPHVGYALPRAIERGLDMRAVVMDGGYWDCGTVSGYTQCLVHIEQQRVRTA